MQDPHPSVHLQPQTASPQLYDPLGSPRRQGHSSEAGACCVLASVSGFSYPASVGRESQDTGSNMLRDAWGLTVSGDAYI